MARDQVEKLYNTVTSDSAINKGNLRNINSIDAYTRPIKSLYIEYDSSAQYWPGDHQNREDQPPDYKSFTDYFSSESDGHCVHKRSSATTELHPSEEMEAFLYLSRYLTTVYRVLERLELLFSRLSGNPKEDIVLIDSPHYNGYHEILGGQRSPTPQIKGSIHFLTGLRTVIDHETSPGLKFHITGDDDGYLLTKLDPVEADKPKYNSLKTDFSDQYYQYADADKLKYPIDGIEHYHTQCLEPFLKTLLGYLKVANEI